MVFQSIPLVGGYKSITLNGVIDSFPYQTPTSQRNVSNFNYIATNQT